MDNVGKSVNNRNKRLYSVVNSGLKKNYVVNGLLSTKNNVIFVKRKSI